MHSSLSQSRDTLSDNVCGIVALGAVVHQANDGHLGLHLLPTCADALAPHSLKRL